jgi:uncharacterized protein
MIIFISGAGGFLGKALSSHFRSLGWEVRPLRRVTAATPLEEVTQLLEGADVVVNVSGSPIIGRWTEKFKTDIFESRIFTTAKLSGGLTHCQRVPRLFLSASAIGIYPSEEVHTETAVQFSTEYLGKICLRWEEQAFYATRATRTATARIGIVLGREGGMLKRVLPLFRYGLGGTIGSGNQAFSWIHIHDLCRAFQYIIENDSVYGPVNLTAPEITDNAGFTQTLASVLHRPALFNVPESAIRMLYGQGAQALLTGQSALPALLQQAGFRHEFPVLRAALTDLVRK